MVFNPFPFGQHRNRDPIDRIIQDDIAFGALLVWGAVWRRTTIIATCITPAPPRIFVTLTRKGRFHMLQAIGLCRFSYPALGGFQVEHETIEERIAYLYEENVWRSGFNCSKPSPCPA